MLFPTVDFGIFFILVFAVSWFLVKLPAIRKHFLLIASYVFYGWWDWRFCGLLALNALINYSAALLVSDAKSEGKRKLWLGVAVTLNLAILATFKYLDWFMQSLSDVLIAVGLERDVPLFDLILPVGISFFTFQGISYVVDVYRRKIDAERSPFEVALYISFFPQLVAGPIVRAAEFMPQLKKPPVLTNKMAAFGMVLILVGVFKKMIVANYLATLYVDEIFFDPASQTSLDLLLGVYGYAIQIYCDFSGYSDIAIGVAALLGYRFNVNFNQPYRASSLQDFWRRWHISLSSWLRDYLYIPLGGNKGGVIKTYRNLLLTMLLGGIWHGAAWTFVIWGLIHGGVLAVERAITNGRRSAGNFVTKLLGILFTFHVVCLAWIFFRSETLDGALTYIEGLGAFTVEFSIITPFILSLIIATMVFQFTPSDLLQRAGGWMERAGALPRAAVFVVGLLLIQWVAPNDVAPFIYFQF